MHILLNVAQATGIHKDVFIKGQKWYGEAEDIKNRWQEQTEL